MATFDRAPEHSSVITVMIATAAFPVFGWSIVQVLRQVPSWALRLEAWDLVGVIAYTQAIALVETIMVAALAAGMAFILSRIWEAIPSVEWVGLWVFVGALSASAFHLLEGAQGVGKLAAGAVSAGLFVALVVPGSLLLSNRRWRQTFHSIVQRMSVLAYFYLLIGIVSAAIVLVRNL